MKGHFEDFSHVFLPRTLTGFKLKNKCLSRLLTILSWLDYIHVSKQRAGLFVCLSECIFKAI